MKLGVRFTSISPPEDNGCEACLLLKNQRLFCLKHRADPNLCPWCLNKGFRPVDGKWDMCGCWPSLRIMFPDRYQEKSDGGMNHSSDTQWS